MNLELNTQELNQLKNLIFDKIDQVGGLNHLNPELLSILKKIPKKAL